MLHIRMMQECDIQKVEILEKQLFGDAWSKESIKDSLHLECGECVVAEEDGEISGYYILYKMGTEAEIIRIGVERAFWSQGIGTLLIRKMEQQCRQNQIHRIILDVRESNARARAFYKQHHFTEDGTRKDFYTAPREHAVLMSSMLAVSL